MEKKDRSFKILYIRSKSKGIKSKKGGRYISKTPIGAAKKAFNKECNKSKIKGVCTMFIILIETTRNSKNKIYRYKIKRKKLKKPIEIERDNKIIKYNYKIDYIKSINRMFHNISKKYKEGGGKMEMDEEMDEYEKEGIYTGYYNIIVNDKIVKTHYFLLSEEESDEYIVKNILKKHKKDLKKINKKGINKISVELFDIMFYPSEEGPRAIKDVLEIQLPLIEKTMRKMDKEEVKKKTDVFNFDNLKNILDNI